MNLHITLHRDKKSQSHEKIKLRHELAIANDARGTKR
jgi:hypothetical protein